MLKTKVTLGDLTDVQLAVVKRIQDVNQLAIRRLSVDRWYSQGSGGSFEASLAEKQPFDAVVNFGNQDNPILLDIEFTLIGLDTPVSKIAYLRNADEHDDLALMYMHQLKLLWASKQMAEGAAYYAKLVPAFTMSDRAFKFGLYLNDEYVGEVVSKHADIHITTATVHDLERDEPRNEARGIAAVFNAMQNAPDEQAIPAAFRTPETHEPKSRLKKADKKAA